MDIETKSKRKTKTVLPEEPVESSPFQATNKDALLALLDSAPQVPLLNNPKEDPQHIMATTFNPAYREFLSKLRRFAEQ